MYIIKNFITLLKFNFFNFHFKPAKYIHITKFWIVQKNIKYSYDTLNYSIGQGEFESLGALGSPLLIEKQFLKKYLEWKLNY